MFSLKYVRPLRELELLVCNFVISYNAIYLTWSLLLLNIFSCVFLLSDTYAMFSRTFFLEYYCKFYFACCFQNFIELSSQREWFIGDKWNYLWNFKLRMWIEAQKTDSLWSYLCSKYLNQHCNTEWLSICRGHVQYFLT